MFDYSPFTSVVSPHCVRARLKMHLKAMIQREFSYTSRQRLSELGDTHGGHHSVFLEFYLQTVIEWAWCCTSMP